MNKELFNKSITWGVITGIIYMVLILIQNMFFSNNVLGFSTIKIITYLVIVGMFFYHATVARKMHGGYITMQEVFGAVFVVILIAELFYSIFNIVYVKFIDPQFLEKISNNTINMMEKYNMPQEKIDDLTRTFEEGKGKQLSIGSQIQSYLFSVIIDNIFGLIIAAIIKKTKPVEFE
jgi:hypothetical protein